MNAPIRRLATVVTVLFTALLISTTYIQFVAGAALRDRAGNQRTLLATYSRERGSILVGGAPIASSVVTRDELKYRRTYPQARLYSQVTGYYSYIYGAGGGLEGTDNALLSGSSDKLFYRRVVDLVSGNQQPGASIELTIDAKAQAAADKGLGNQRGAVVALDPRTGAVLAMVSHPQYDPSALAGHTAAPVIAAWKSLIADPERPAVNRALNGDLYPPGSTFKLVTAAAALSSGRYTPSTLIPGPGTLKLPQTSATLPNHGNHSCATTSGGRTTVEHALVVSCNTAFGYLGLKLGGAALRKQADKFGFDTDLKLPLPVTPSVVPSGMNPPQSAQSAIGQFDVRVSPLEMAMVSAAIANHGTLMSPYLVAQARSSSLDVVDRTTPRRLSQAVTAAVAGDLQTMMLTVVKSGTGNHAQIPGVAVAGKTGTAEHGAGRAPHAWFTGFAPAGNPVVAVAVLVEDGGKAGQEGFGGTIAAPVAREVMKAVLGR